MTHCFPTRRTFDRPGRGLRRVHRGRHPASPQAWAARHLAVSATPVAHRHAPPAGGRLGGRPCTDLTLRLLDHPKVCSKGVTMSRFKHEITHLQANIKTLRLGPGARVIVALFTSAELRLGKECVRTCGSRCLRTH